MALYVTGMGKVNAATSLTSILNDSRFDFSDTYIISVGCAGSAIEYGTMGDVFIITSAVDYDLGHKADVREMTNSDSETTWYHDASYDGSAFKHLNTALTDQVYEVTKDVKLETTDQTRKFMKDEFDKVDPEIARRLRHELQVKVLDPYMNDSSFEWMARGAKGTAQNNWNVRCNCNTLMAFMLLENDRETLAKAVLESMRSVDQYVNYITHDGACDEGPSYWNTAGAQLYDYVEILKAITGGKVNLLSHPYLKRAGEYICHSFIGLDWVVNFADAPARGSSSPFVVYRFGKGVNSEIMKHFAAALYRKDNTPTSFGIGSDIYRIFEAMTIQKELAATSPEQIREPFVWYPETEFCYLSDPDGLFVAAKGGNNNESHNHNDVGTFILYMDNQPVMIDAGVGTYRRQTFDSSRYTIWTMQSNYHNLPMINGVAQKDGADYKASEAVAKPGFFSVNIAGAFPEEAKVDRWTRSYQLNGKALRVNDAFTLKQAVAPNVVNFLTWGDVKKVTDGKVTISVNGVDALLTYDPRSFDYSIETITLDDPRLSDVWGKEVYRVSLKAKKMTRKGNYSFTIKKL